MPALWAGRSIIGAAAAQRVLQQTRVARQEREREERESDNESATMPVLGSPSTPVRLQPRSGSPTTSPTQPGQSSTAENVSARIEGAAGTASPSIHPTNAPAATGTPTQVKQGQLHPTPSTSTSTAEHQRPESIVGSPATPSAAHSAQAQLLFPGLAHCLASLEQLIIALGHRTDKALPAKILETLSTTVNAPQDEIARWFDWKYSQVTGPVGPSSAAPDLPRGAKRPRIHTDDDERRTIPTSPLTPNRRDSWPIQARTSPASPGDALFSNVSTARPLPTRILSSTKVQLRDSPPLRNASLIIQPMLSAQPARAVPQFEPAPPRPPRLTPRSGEPLGPAASLTPSASMAPRTVDRPTPVQQNQLRTRFDLRAPSQRPDPAFRECDISSSSQTAFTAHLEVQQVRQQPWQRQMQRQQQQQQRQRQQQQQIAPSRAVPALALDWLQPVPSETQNRVVQIDRQHPSTSVPPLPAALGTHALGSHQQHATGSQHTAIASSTNNTTAKTIQGSGSGATGYGVSIPTLNSLPQARRPSGSRATSVALPQLQHYPSQQPAPLSQAHLGYNQPIGVPRSQREAAPTNAQSARSAQMDVIPVTQAGTQQPPVAPPPLARAIVVPSQASCAPVPQSYHPRPAAAPIAYRSYIARPPTPSATSCLTNVHASGYDIAFANSTQVLRAIVPSLRGKAGWTFEFVTRDEFERMSAEWQEQYERNGWSTFNALLDYDSNRKEFEQCSQWIEYKNVFSSLLELREALVMGWPAPSSAPVRIMQQQQQPRMLQHQDQQTLVQHQQVQMTQPNQQRMEVQIQQLQQRQGRLEHHHHQLQLQRQVQRSMQSAPSTAMMVQSQLPQPLPMNVAGPQQQQMREQPRYAAPADSTLVVPYSNSSKFTQNFPSWQLDSVITLAFLDLCASCPPEAPELLDCPFVCSIRQLRPSIEQLGHLLDPHLQTWQQRVSNMNMRNRMCQNMRWSFGFLYRPPPPPQALPSQVATLTQTVPVTATGHGQPNSTSVQSTPTAGPTQLPPRPPLSVITSPLAPLAARQVQYGPASHPSASPVSVPRSTASPAFAVSTAPTTPQVGQQKDRETSVDGAQIFRPESVLPHNRPAVAGLQLVGVATPTPDQEPKVLSNSGVRRTVVEWEAEVKADPEADLEPVEISLLEARLPVEQGSAVAVLERAETRFNEAEPVRTKMEVFEDDLDELMSDNSEEVPLAELLGRREEVSLSARVVNVVNAHSSLGAPAENKSNDNRHASHTVHSSHTIPPEDIDDSEDELEILRQRHLARFPNGLAPDGEWSGQAMAVDIAWPVM